MQYTTETHKGKNGKVLFLTLPVWETLTTETMIADLEALLAEGRALVEQLVKNNTHTFDSLVLPLEEHANRLHLLWSPVNHLNAVAQTDALREVCTKGAQLIAEYETEMGQHEGLSRAYQSIKESSLYGMLTLPQKKIIDDTCRDFVLSGVLLPPESKERVRAINAELTTLSDTFGNHLKDVDEKWGFLVSDIAVLEGIPEVVIQELSEDAKTRGYQEGFWASIKASVAPVILANATNRELRKKVSTAWVTAGSAELSGMEEYDNAKIVAQMLKLRHEKAQLLGFDNYAVYSLAQKMAGSTDIVFAFLNQLAEKGIAPARLEFEKLAVFAKEKFGYEVLESWDTAFVAEALRKETYAISQEELRPYFTETKVFQGFFELLNKIYGVTVHERKEVSAWISGVRFYEVYDKEGVLRGGFYVDLIARAKKNGGAWVDVCIPRRLTNEGIQLPVAYLNCNFTKPAAGEECAMTHAEVETVFHEGGHVLHHVLGLTEYMGVGMMSVEWDAVECPSQLMENWCFDTSVLKVMGVHNKTGEVIPDVLCERLIRAKRYNAAIALMRQLELALSDFTLHAMYNPLAPENPMDVVSTIRRRVRVTPVYEHDRYLMGFSHIFDGSYSAGYYSYKWAEVLSADIFEAYLEVGNIFDHAVGLRFLNEVLEVGSARPMMESFCAFRGREPKVDALLRSEGLLQ